MNIVIASGNRHKVREFTLLLKTLGCTWRIVPPQRIPEVQETGSDFEENAAIKARAYASANALPSLADDSGLVVPALGGLPGVRSARFAGENATDAANNAKLLQMLKGVKDRRAFFVCHVCLAFPDGRIYTAAGKVEGMILGAPRGHGGFGYDPLFFAPEIGKSFAQATEEEKARISHRRRALSQLLSRLLA